MVRYRPVLAALIGAILLAAPHVRAQGLPHDFRVCVGDYALCAASTCTPTGGTIAVNTASGPADFPAAQCTCPIFSGPALANVKHGNMQGSCEPPPNNGVWSLYFPMGQIPQAINNWSQGSAESAAPKFVCPAELGLGTQLANCANFACERAGEINGVAVATCVCPLGESLEGTPVPANTAFATQAGQCHEDICAQHPVSGGLPHEDILGGQCLLPPPLPPGVGS